MLALVAQKFAPGAKNRISFLNCPFHQKAAPFHMHERGVGFSGPSLKKRNMPRPLMFLWCSCKNIYGCSRTIALCGRGLRGVFLVLRRQSLLCIIPRGWSFPKGRALISYFLMLAYCSSLFAAGSVYSSVKTHKLLLPLFLRFCQYKLYLALPNRKCIFFSFGILVFNIEILRGIS